MTRVDTTQRRYEPLPWMITPPVPPPSPLVPASLTPAPVPHRAEETLTEIHSIREAIRRIEREVQRIADATEVEAAFVQKDRQHHRNQIKRLEEEVKSKDTALQDTKSELQHLRSALTSDKSESEKNGYPDISKELLEGAVHRAAVKTPSESEFGDLLVIADGEVEGTSSGTVAKSTVRGKRKAFKADSTVPDKKASAAPSSAGTVA